MLSKDIATEFRGRGDEVHIAPLSFAELYGYCGGDKAKLFREYLTYGGMPMTLYQKTDADKKRYLSGLFRETYLLQQQKKQRGDENHETHASHARKSPGDP